MIYIYVLVDPIDEKTAYVGKTKNLSARYKSHVSLSDSANRFKTAWIKKLLKRKRLPLLYVLEQVDGRRWKSREKFWIANLPSLGFELTNVLHTPFSREYYSKLQKAAYRKRKRESRLYLLEQKKVEKLQPLEVKTDVKVFVGPRKQEQRNDYFSFYMRASSALDLFTRCSYVISKLILTARNDKIKRLYLNFLHELNKPKIRRHTGCLFGILLVLHREGEDTSFLNEVLKRVSGCQDLEKDRGEFCGWSWDAIANPSIKLYERAVIGI